MPQDRPEEYTLPERDIQSRIQEVLAGISQPESQQGFWARLLQAIPQALAVGVSDNPGAALGQQIATQFQQVQIEKQRRQRLKELGATLEIEDLLERSREGRREAADIRKGKREADIRKEEFGYTSKESREQLRIKNQFDVDLEKLRQTNNLDLATIQQESNKSLEEMKQQGDMARLKMATILQQATSLMPYMSGGEAADIMERALDNNLTKADLAAIQSAAKKGEKEEFRQKYALAVGPAREAAKLSMVRSTQAEIIEAIKKKSFEQEWMWVTDPQGRRQLFKYDIDPVMGTVAVPPGYKFESKADPMEAYQHFIPLAQAFSGPSGLGTIDQTKDQNKDQIIDKFIGELPISMTPDNKVRALSDPRVVQQLGITPQDVERAKVRIMATVPTSDPTELAIREIDEELRSLEAPAVSRISPGGVLPSNYGLSDKEKKQRAKLLDERYALVKRKKDEEEVKYLEDLLAQKEQELATARTEVRKTRLKTEIEAPKTGLRDRLKYAKSQVGK